MNTKNIKPLGKTYLTIVVKADSNSFVLTLTAIESLRWNPEQKLRQSRQQFHHAT